MNTTTPGAATSTGRGHRLASHGWRIVAAFAVTQTIGYGCLYYTFAVLLHPIADDLHTSPTAVTGAFTTAILAWAAAAIPVGRWLDRHGGRALMTVGSAAGALLLVAWSRIEALWQLYAVFAALGVAMAMALYDAATAVIVTWFDTDRRPRAILAMIVVAGFASTIFMPLTGQLEHRYGWRTTLLILAVLYAALAVPLHAIAVRAPATRPGRTAPPSPAQRAAAVRAARRDGRFWWLAVAFIAHSAAMSTMTVHLVGFLVSRGHPATFAATAAGLLGVLSVTGRLLLTGARRRLPLTTIVAAVFTIQAIAAAALPFIADTRAGAVAGIIAFGIGFGVSSLAAPALLADRYGTTAYATIASTLNTPVTLAKAGAPLAAAGLTSLTGHTGALTAIAAACTLAAVGILARADAAPAGYLVHAAQAAC
ncbi:MFS transporter [Dactylosporangium sp. McL0621]|uniref:MFS transporter n=1 Tax=Dactylosporangium sp. McL0621 TaxID=3415678 RepID=UPI003CFB4135